MEMTSTRTVIVDGKARDYPLGTSWWTGMESCVS